MAINVRIPEELDRQLSAVAEEQHISKSALLLQGAELVVARHSRRNEVAAGLDFIFANDAELLVKLEDA